MRGAASTDWRPLLSLLPAAACSTVSLSLSLSLDPLSSRFALTSPVSHSLVQSKSCARLSTCAPPLCPSPPYQPASPVPCVSPPSNNLSFFSLIAGPLNHQAVMGLTALALEEPDLPPVIKDYLRTSLDSCTGLLGIIAQMLEVRE